MAKVEHSRRTEFSGMPSCFASFTFDQPRAHCFVDGKLGGNDDGRAARSRREWVTACRGSARPDFI